MKGSAAEWWVENPDGYQGDASLAAVAYLKDLPPSVKTLHVVRDPLAACRSWLATQVFDDGWEENPFRIFLETVAPEMREAEDPLCRVIRYLEGCTRRILERAPGPYRMVQIEQTASERRRFADVVRWLGYELPAKVVLPGDVNRHERLELEWEDLDEHSDGELLRELARWTGYQQ